MLLLPQLLPTLDALEAGQQDAAVRPLSAALLLLLLVVTALTRVWGCWFVWQQTPQVLLLLLLSMHLKVV